MPKKVVFEKLIKKKTHSENNYILEINYKCLPSVKKGTVNISEKFDEVVLGKT